MSQSYYYLQLKSHDLVVPYSQKTRRIRVLLPKQYEADINKSYPVVYLHDGQNVFYSRESYSGHSWKMIHAIKKNPDLAKMIVVGIDNDGHERMNEYSAWKYGSGHHLHHKNLGGKGSDYADFIMGTVKPFIDSQYRTKADKAHTAMIGSSLGANITQFMGVEFQEKIGGLGIFSSANFLTREPFNRLIGKTQLDPDQRIFIQVGTQEADETDQELYHGNVKQAYMDESLLYFRQLLQAGIPLAHIDFHLVADAEHKEEVWAHFLPSCLYFLSQDW